MSIKVPTNTMCKKITIACPSMSLHYDGTYITYRIKGVRHRESVYSYTDFDELPKPVYEYLFGRRVRAQLHRACAARGWKSPLKSYDEMKERQQKEAAKAASDKLYYDNLAQKNQQLKERAETFLRVPSQTNWEVLYDGEITGAAVLCNGLPEPKSYSTRSALIDAIHTAQRWGALYDRLMNLPIHRQVGRSNRAYYENLYYQNGGFNFPRWVWDWKNYIIEATNRLQELQSYDF